MKTISIIFICILIISCSADKKELTDILNYKLNKIEATIEKNGNKRKEKAIKNELFKALNQIDKNGILTKTEIERLGLHNFDRERLKMLSDTIDPTFIDKFKFYLIDFYQEKIDANNVCFDNLKVIAVKKKDNKIDLYLTANYSPILPNIYLTKGDSALKIINKNKTVNPINIDLESIEFDKLYKPIQSDETIFGYYMIPAWQTDTAFVIKNEDVINATK